MDTKIPTEEGWIQEWKETLPKSLLRNEDFNKLLTNPNLINNKWVSVRYIKSKSTMGLKEAGIYYEIWIENDCKINNK